MSKQFKTRGERRIYQLLQRLPSEQFYHYYEPRLMTENGSLKPDFVIVSATLGVIVVEVKDWKRIVSGNQQEFEIETVEGEIIPIENPVVTAENYAYTLASLFQKRREWLVKRLAKLRLPFPWQPAVVLPNISQKVIDEFVKAGIWEKGIVLGKESIENLVSFETALKNLPWKFKLQESLNEPILNTIRGVLQPMLIVETDTEDSGTLSRAQTRIVMEEINEAAENLLVRLVVGVAGSGKTLVITRRVRYLKEHFPNYKILVMAYNRDLVNDIKNRIGDDDVDVYGFHQLCHKISPPPRGEFVDVRRWVERNVSDLVEQTGLTSQYITEEIDWRKDAEIFTDAAYLAAVRKGRVQRLTQEKRQLINEIFNRYRQHQEELRQAGKMWMDGADLALTALEVVEQGHPLKHHYDAVLIDEAQDFAPPWIKLAKLLQKPTGTMLLCEDPLQSLFRSFTWQEKGVSVVGRSVTLRVPFRSSREICTAAYSLIEADAVLNAEKNVEPNLTSQEISSGDLPILLECADMNSEFEAVESRIDALLNAGVKAHKIAVLCHSHYVMNQFKDLEKRGCILKTFGTMKGLEFQAVFVPHLQDVFQRADAEDGISTVRRKIFTAMTRAKELLVISYQNTLPDALQPLLECTQLEVIGK
jgi:hypothetical protein